MFFVQETVFCCVEWCFTNFRFFLILRAMIVTFLYNTFFDKHSHQIFKIDLFTNVSLLMMCVFVIFVFCRSSVPIHINFLMAKKRKE